METIIQEGSLKTPEIKVDNEKGIISLRGRSNPENSNEYYRPLMNWLDEYILKPAPVTSVEVNLEHFNTSSSKCLLDMLKKIKKLFESGRECRISWYYEDDDEEMLETAEIFESMTGLKIEKIGVPEA